jgi:hypothetical protein
MGGLATLSAVGGVAIGAAAYAGTRMEPPPTS